MTFATGDRVRIAVDDRTVDGVVTLASPNGRALMLEFEAWLVGHVGSMPVFQHNDGIFRTLVGGYVVMITHRDR